ncbi:MAG: hypothetical protein AAGA32_12130 [Pseudomonadota bacterium]
MSALAWIARRGRLALVAGLLAGLTLPELAALIRPWLPECVALLLFLTAFRIGHVAALGAGEARGRALILVLLFQLALPLAALGIAKAVGVETAPLAVVLVLMLSAPAVSASPNVAIMLGHDPAPALRLVIIGTALLPLTVLPVLALSPVLGSPEEVAAAALRLLGVISIAVVAGFGLRAVTGLPDARREALDGAAAIALAVIVVGLMSALGPALASDPLSVAAWGGAAFAANFGLQLACHAAIGATPDRVPVSIVAGNRNIALFLVALPEAVTDPLLVFIGCYQIPMYLTPILLRRVYPPPPEAS